LDAIERFGIVVALGRNRGFLGDGLLLFAAIALLAIGRICRVIAIGTGRSGTRLRRLPGARGLRTFLRGFAARGPRAGLFIV
jgi:hypothetical protein